MRKLKTAIRKAGSERPKTPKAQYPILILGRL